VAAASLARVARPLLGLTVFFAALGVWETWARSEGSVLIPPASSVLEAAWQVWPTADFLRGVAASLERLAAGFVIGVGIGVGLGLVMGSSRGTRRALEPLVEFGRAMPAIAIVPAAIVLLGLGSAMQITVIAFALCFPVLINTVEGVRAVSPEVRDTAAMLQVGPIERTFRIYLPGALPSIVAGLRVAVSLGVVAVVISEFAGEGEGLGRYIRLQQTEFNVPAMYCGILFLGVLGYTLNQLFLVAERRLLSWHFGSVGESAR
jgi:ABC-type nitrate/sulfonate/bicarbonate transport system permease component